MIYFIKRVWFLYKNKGSMSGGILIPVYDPESEVYVF